jgi:hypothetical protein
MPASGEQPPQWRGIVGDETAHGRVQRTAQWRIQGREAHHAVARQAQGLCTQRRGSFGMQADAYAPQGPGYPQAQRADALAREQAGRLGVPAGLLIPGSRAGAQVHDDLAASVRVDSLRPAVRVVVRELPQAGHVPA